MVFFINLESENVFRRGMQLLDMNKNLKDDIELVHIIRCGTRICIFSIFERYMKRYDGNNISSIAHNTLTTTQALNVIEYHGKNYYRRHIIEEDEEKHELYGTGGLRYRPDYEESVKRLLDFEKTFFPGIDFLGKDSVTGSELFSSIGAHIGMYIPLIQKSYPIITLCSNIWKELIGIGSCCDVEGDPINITVRINIKQRYLLTCFILLGLTKGPQSIFLSGLTESDKHIWALRVRDMRNSSSKP